MDMFERITSFDNFYNAFKKTQRGKAKYKKQALDFYDSYQVQLEDLRQSVINGTYQPGKYNRFVVMEPKEREVLAPQYVDKIVQHAINNVLKDFFLPRYIKTSYACIEGRGNTRAVRDLQKMMYKASNKFKQSKPYIVKIDAVKFFYSIDRDILKRELETRIRCRRTLALLGLIIDNCPGTKGLPLGNLTSQLKANVYLNVVDQYAKRELRLKQYLRYADDIFVIVRDKTSARIILDKLRVFLKETLQLDTSDDKSDIAPLEQGIKALGYYVLPTHIRLLKKSKLTIIRHLDRLKEETYKVEDIPKAESRIHAWQNFARIARYHSYLMSLLNNYDFLIYIPERDLLKLKEPLATQ